MLSKHFNVFVFCALFSISNFVLSDIVVPESVIKEINSFKLKKPIYRTKSEARIMLEKVIERVNPSAVELCKKTGLSIEKCNWDLEVISGNQFNAYASGNNKISFFTGLVRGVHYEDELAFVVAHEIGHHLANHLNESRGRSILGAVLGAALGMEDGYGIDAAIIGSNIGSLSFSKKQELEADAISIKILKDSGYDLEKARMGVIRLTRTGPSRMYSVFSDTHPSGPERVMWFDEISKDE